MLQSKFPIINPLVENNWAIGTQPSVPQFNWPNPDYSKDWQFPENWRILAETIPPITFIDETSDKHLRKDYNELITVCRLIVKLHIRNNIGGDTEYDNVISDLVELI